MDIHNQASNANYLLDGYIAGYDTSFFQTVSGTSPVAVSGLIPFNSNKCSSRASFKYGDFEFKMIVPTAPTAGDDRTWGLISTAMGLNGAIFFTIQDAVFSVCVYDDAGVALLDQDITWDAGWTGAEVSYRIKWNRDVVEFSIGGTQVAHFRVDSTIQHTLSTYSLPISIQNINVDDMSLRYLALRDVRFVQSPNGMGTISLSTGDIELGAVELKDATTETRAEISTADAGNTTETNVLKTQPVDENGVVITNGGSTLAGDSNIYSTEQGDFTATPTDATFEIVLSVDALNGQSITAASFANAVLKVLDVSLTPDEWKTITLDKFTWTVGTMTLDITNCTGAVPPGRGEGVGLDLVGADKKNDTMKKAMVNNPIRDLSDQYQSLTYTLTNVPNATPDETILIDLDGYKGWSVQVEKTGGTDTFAVGYFVSNQGALSTDTWLEVTPTFASGSATADHIAHPANEMLVTKGLKLIVTTAGTANDADFQISVKLWY